MLCLHACVEDENDDDHDDDDADDDNQNTISLDRKSKQNNQIRL